jgi:hypothetical protein
MSRKQLFPDFFGSPEDDPLLSDDDASSEEEDASASSSRTPPPSNRSRGGSPSSSSSAPSWMRGGSAERPSSGRPSSGTSSSTPSSRRRSSSEQPSRPEPRSPLFARTSDAARARRRRRQERAANGARPKAKPVDETKQAMVVKQVRGAASGLDELNRAIQRGWRLVHIAPISRRPSAELTQTDFAALVTLERPGASSSPPPAPSRSSGA